MSFGPTNTSTFYNTIMIDSKCDWIQLYKELYCDPKLLLCRKQEVVGSTFIVDNFLLWLNGVAVVLNLISYICRLFKNYRCSFKLSKWDILQPPYEYIGIGISKDWNNPASSKYQTILDWWISLTGESIFSFVGLMVVYNKCVPWKEINITTLGQLLLCYRR